MKAYRRILTLDSTDAVVWLHMGKALQQDEQNQAARRAFQRVLELAPAHSEARRRLDQLNAAS